MKSLAKINSSAASTASKQKATIQPKLKVSSPGDQYEQEADAMAERVMHFSGESTTEPISTTGIIARSVQRKTEMDAGNTTILSGSGAGFMAPMGLVSQLGNTGNGGSTLPVDTRGFMEDAFSTDFAGVRIHTDSGASAMAESIQAKAFTYGEDIYFNAGEFNPQTDEGKELLAHELTHVIQQRNGIGGGLIQRRVNPAVASTTSSPLGVAQLFIDRLNRQSAAIRYQFSDNSFTYTVINEAALSNFDWQMRAVVDLGEAFLIKLADLLTMSGLPETARSGQFFADLNGLLANDDATFQNLVVGFFGGAAAIPAVDEVLSPASVDPGVALAAADTSSSDVEAAATRSLEPVTTASEEATEQTALVEEVSQPVTDALPTTEDAASAQAPLSPDLLMPEAPSTLSAPAQERLSQAQSAASSNASRSGSLPSDSEITAEARGGVSEPEEETQARASGSLTEALAQRAEPSPEIEALCANIQRAIRERRPPDEDSLLSADPEAAANEVGDQLNTSISDDADRVGSSYDELDNPPAGSPEQVGETPTLPPTEFEETSVNATQAVPDSIPAENVSLDNDVQSTQSSMDEAGMTSAAADAITDPTNPVVMAREAQGELEETATQEPAQVLEAQNTAIADAQTHMEELQTQALQALVASRSGTVTETGQQQTALIGTEEQKRAEVGRRAEAIFTTAQAGVEQLLQPLTQTAMDMWDTGKTRISTEFRQHLDRVQRWVDDRYSGAGGFVLEVVEDVIGMPDWVTEQYNDAEQTFSDDICAKIREISTHVNTVIMACEEIINNADRDIARVFEDARGELGDWVDQQREGFASRIEGLRTQVHETRDNFNRDLATQAAETVQAVREEVHALRQAAGGLVGRIRDAIAAFADDPVRFIIDGLLSLVGIEPARFWALANRIGTVIDDLAADPMRFASNLLAAVGDGFGLFFDNFGTHLLDGLIGWLFSGLGAMGIEVPRELSLSSIVTFFLQVMGITWDRIRRLLAEQIGEENVELIEQAFEMVSNLIEMGPAGIFEMIKDMLNPQTILDSIIQMAIDFMVETIATQAATRFALLFVPGGAIAQAVEAIYKVLRWVFENAASIFTLVETVVNGIANIISGNTAAMSLAVEQALSRLMIPVIDFVAGFLNMGDLPQRVADAVEGMQEWMEGLLRRAIRWMADQARALMSALGFGEEEEEEDEEDGLEDTEVGESINFSAEGERHRLWIDDNNGNMRIMVASEATDLETKIRSWTGNLSQLQEPSTRDEARSLLTQTSNQLSITLTEAEQAALAIREVESHLEDQTAINNAQTQDNDVEAAERQLVTNLVRLFELFEGESLVEKYRDQLGHTDPSAVNDIMTELTENADAYGNQSSWESIKASLINNNNPIKYLHEKPLGTSAHNHDFGRFNYTAFERGLSTAMSQEGKTDQNLGGKTQKEYASNRTGVIHGGSPPEGEQETLTPRQTLLQALHDQLFNLANRPASISAMVAYFVKSLRGSATHQEYRPQNIRSRIENGTLVVTYDYGEDAERKGGKRDFIAQVRLSDVSGRTVVQTTQGNNLALKVPGTRGYTASSGTFGSDVETGNIEIHSAHLLADQFMGSGYKSALNLVLTSARFNTEIMFSAESSITDQIRNIQLANPQKLVTFKMIVRATWEALPDDPVIENLRRILPSATTNLTPEELSMLAEETKLNLESKQDPRRCKQVNYMALIFGNGQVLGLATASTAEEDIWLNPTFT